MSAVELATAYIALVPSLKGANKAISDQIGPAATEAGSSGGERVGSGMLSRIGRIVTGVAIGNLVSNAMSSLGGMFTGFIKDAASASDATDKFKATLNFAGLDTSAIDAATAATQKYADQTVYDLPTIQNTTAQLAANGVKNYEGLTEAAGNLNAVAGGNAETFKSVALAITQTTGAGKLQTQNWMQLAEAVPGAAGKLQDAMKEAGAYTGNFNDAMANGQITADEFNAAIEKLGMQDGAVQAAKSTTTFEGAIGNLQATIQGGLTRALNAAKPVITGTINLLTAGLGAAFSHIGNVAKNFSDGFRNGVDAIGSNQSALAHWGAASFEAFDKARAGMKMSRAEFSAIGKDIDPLVAFGFKLNSSLHEVIGSIRAFGAAWKDNNGDVTSNGLAGAMERLANTARPIFDSIVAAVRQLGPAFVGVLPQIIGLVTAFSPLHLIFQALAPVLPQLVTLFGQLAGAALSGLAKVLPVITAGMHGLVTVVSNIVTWLLQFNGMVQALAVGIGVAVVGFKLYEGAVLAIQAVTKAWAVVQGILNVVMDANPISLIIIGIAALIAGIILLVANWDNVVSFITTIWGGFINWMGSVMDGFVGWLGGIWNSIVSGITAFALSIFTPIADGFNAVLAFISGVWNSIATGVSEAWSVISAAVGAAIAVVVTPIIEGFTNMVNFVVGIFTTVGNAIVGAWTWVFNLLIAIGQAFWAENGAAITAGFNYVMGIFQGALDFIVGIWNAIANGVMTAVNWVVSIISAGFTAAYNWVTSILTSVWGFITSIWNQVAGFIGSVLGFIGAGIAAAWNWYVGIIVGALSAVWGFISSIFNTVAGFIAGVWDGIVGVIAGAVGAVWGAISSGFGAAWGFISSVFGQVASFLGGIWDNIVNGVSGMIGNVVGALSGLGGTIMGALSGAGSWLFDIGKNIVEGLISGISSLAGTIGNAFLSLIPGWIVGPFKAALGIASPSKVFRGFGRNIVEGVILGTEDKSSDLMSTMGGLVPTPDFPSSAAAMPGASSYGAGRNLTINNTINQVDDPIGTAQAIARRQVALSV